jgi:ABC-type nitrate/sulfonate/bicarbonate transport system substrate-binding protein
MVNFKVGQSAPANTFLAIWMADAAGFYRDRGLQIDVVPMVGGRQAGPSLTNRHIQLMHIGLSSVVRANAAGASLVAVGSLSNVIRGTLFGGPGVTDLKGGVIGISSAGSESDAAATLALKRLGLTRREVTVKEIGLGRLAALRDGGITAAMLDEPQRSQALQAGLEPMIDFLSERVPWLYTGLVVTRSYLAEHRGTVRDFLAATIDGNHLAVADAERGKEVLARALELTDAETIDICYDNFKTFTPANAEIDAAGAENIIATVAPDTGAVAEDYIDTSLIDELRTR